MTATDRISVELSPAMIQIIRECLEQALPDRNSTEWEDIELVYNRLGLAIGEPAEQLVDWDAENE